MASDLLRSHLVRFRATYYKLRAIIGLLLVLLWGLGTFLVASLTEGLFWWKVPVRLILWSAWLGGTAYLFVSRVLWPLLQYGFRLKGYLSDEEAARWIGRHLPEIQDKLLNALQLERASDTAQAAIALALEERQKVVLRYPWEVSLPRAPIRRFGLLLGLVIGMGTLLWLSIPQVLGGGAHRFLRPTQAFTPPLPYKLTVQGLRPIYRRGEPLSLQLHLEGSKLPGEIYARQDGDFPLPLRRHSSSQYELTLPAVERPFTLQVSDGENLLGSYAIRVERPPVIRKILTVVSYPAYTGLAPDTVLEGRLRVLKGAKLSLWLDIESSMPHQLLAPTLSLRLEGGQWHASLSALTSQVHPIILQSQASRDTFHLSIEILEDDYPSVQLFSEWFEAQSYEQRLRIRLMDDFGFSKAVLWYRILEGTTPGRTQEHYKAYPLAISTQAQQELGPTIHWQKLGVLPGDKVEYYVEVWDNDAVSGPKASRSILYTLHSANEPEKQAIFAALQDSLSREMHALREELDRLLSQKELQTSPQRASALSERFRALRSEMRSLQRLAQEEALFTPELLEKMEALQKILDAIDPQKVEQLLAQPPPRQDSTEIAKRLEELQKAYEAWKEKLERWESLLPAYQEARKLEELMTRLDALSETQRQLSQQPDSLNTPPSEKATQQRLSEETQKVLSELDSILKSKRLSESILQDSLQKAQKELQDALRNMRDALQKMERGASPREDQRKASESLENALEAINQGQQAADAQSAAEDYEALRQLLKNILQLSFRQEAVQKESLEARRFLNSLSTLQRKQEEIKRDYRMVGDTLQALASRSPVIEENILDILRDLETHFQGLSYLQADPLLVRQQYILQGLNRLANLMSELLSSLEQQSPSSGGACQKPFRIRRKGSKGATTQGSKPENSGQQPTRGSGRRNSPSPVPNLRQMQQELNESLERLAQPNPGAETPGGLSPSDRARLSAQQELIRLRLQEWLRQNPGDQGQLQDLIQQMQEAEKTLLSGAITRERMLRQQQILTRLLDYEKSQRERELSPERESRTAQQFFQRTVGTYPRPTRVQAPVPYHQPLWFYQPYYQNLIQIYHNP